MFEPEHCDGKIGIFNLIDPDGDGLMGFVADTDNPFTFVYHISEDSVKAQILHCIGEVVDEGGDDPRTPINEETSPTTPVRKYYEDILDQWIRYAIYRGNDEGDCAFVESILSSLVTYHWQKRRYGQKIICGDIDGAANVLTTIQSENPEIVGFKAIQEINLKRLRGLGVGNWISDAEITTIKEIAESELPSSGYARSLYRLFTGNKLPYHIPDMNNYKSNVSPRSSSAKDQLKHEVSIFPNPASDKICIKTNQGISKILVSDITGRVRIENNYQPEIDVTMLSDGLYIINILLADGQVHIQKVIIN